MTYTPHDKMISLISDNYRLIQVMSRFGLPLGFGDKSIEKVCRENGVDCNTFLGVVNFLNTPVSDEILASIQSQISLESLLQYLKQSHNYFLEFCLPAIKRKLLDAIVMKESDVSFLILKLFDEYVEGIREHMEEEENHLFKYVDMAMNEPSNIPPSYSTYSSHHEEVGSKLKELKNIIIKYTPQDARANLLNAALYDIYRCEEELDSHCKVEDMLLVPVLKKKLHPSEA